MIKLMQEKFCRVIFLISILSFNSIVYSESLSVDEIEQLTLKIGKVLKEEYIFPEDALKISSLLEKNIKSNAYKKYKTPFALASRLTEDLRSINNDVHLNIMYTSQSNPGRRMIRKGGPGSQISNQAMQNMKRNNFGFQSVKILEGNIGYINLTSFVNPDYAGETAVAAMQFLGGSDAIIFDLRENRGGAGEMYQLLASYLFDQGPVQLNEIYWPMEDRLYQTWTLPHVPGKRFPNKDIYILTSSNTGSAAEVFSYTLKHHDRATLIGETTVGAANPVSPTKLSDKFTIMLSKGQSKHPITQTNWEGKGVIPHIETSKSQALKTAHLLALENLSKNNPDSSFYYQWFTDIVKSMDSLIQLPSKKMSSYTGIYKSDSGDQRVLTTKDGKLYYGPQQDNTEMLIPLSQNIFMIHGNTGFKLKIEITNNKVTGIKRLFDDGRVISMMRVN